VLFGWLNCIAGVIGGLVITMQEDEYGEKAFVAQGIGVAVAAVSLGVLLLTVGFIAAFLGGDDES
jgi:hypothetical protein